MLIHLVNTAGPHADAKQYVFDEIPEVGPLEVQVRLDRKPRSIVRQQAGEALRFRFEKGRATVRAPRLAIHDILVIQP